MRFVMFCLSSLISCSAICALTFHTRSQGCSRGIQLSCWAGLLIETGKHDCESALWIDLKEGIAENVSFYTSLLGSKLMSQHRW